MENQNVAVARGESLLSTHKVLRNTYTLLGMTLLFSAVTAAISMSLEIGFGLSLISSLIALGLLWFVLPRTANSASGLITTFAFTGLLGFGLGPILSHYISMPGGNMIVMQALGTTALVFFGLSGYSLMSRKDFSFMGGFLAAGIMVAFIASLVGLGGALFGYPMPMLALAVSAMFAVLASGMILWQTSEIINGGETNYIMATVSLYVSIYNLFTSLLHLIGAFSNDE